MQGFLLLVLLPVPWFLIGEILPESSYFRLALAGSLIFSQLFSPGIGWNVYVLFHGPQSVL